MSDFERLRSPSTGSPDHICRGFMVCVYAPASENGLSSSCAVAAGCAAEHSSVHHTFTALSMCSCVLRGGAARARATLPCMHVAIVLTWSQVLLCACHAPAPFLTCVCLSMHVPSPLSQLSLPLSLPLRSLALASCLTLSLPRARSPPQLVCPHA